MSKQSSAVWRQKALAARIFEGLSTTAAEQTANAVVDPHDPWVADLRAALYRAQIAAADAWEEYAKRVEEAFESALLAELEPTT